MKSMSRRIAGNRVAFMPRTITDWVRECHLAAREKGFWKKERNVGEMLMLIVSELGEAIEAHRTNNFGIGKNRRN